MYYEAKSQKAHLPLFAYFVFGNEQGIHVLDRCNDNIILQHQEINLAIEIRNNSFFVNTIYPQKYFK